MIDWYLSHRGLVRHRGVWQTPSVLSDYHRARLCEECNLGKPLVERQRKENGQYAT